MSVTSTIWDYIRVIGFDILVMSLVALVVMLTYSIRSNKRNFVFGCWVRTNRNRFISGAVLIILLATLMNMSSDISALLQLLGVQTKATPVVIGLAVAGILISSVSGNPANTEKKINTKDNR